MAPKPTAKGSGMKRKVMGLPVWVWVAAVGGGLLIGIYLRRKAAAAGQAPASTDTTGTSDASFGAGATPTDNGLGSSSMDMQGFLDAQGQMLQDFGTSMQDLLMQMQSNANGGDFSVPPDMPSGPTDGSTTSATSTPTLAMGNTADLNLNALTPGTLKAAWAAYYAAQRKQGIHTQTTITPSHAGTTQRVSGGGVFTQVSGKVRAIYVKAHGGERAHWALPSGRWVSGPGLY